MDTRWSWSTHVCRCNNDLLPQVNGFSPGPVLIRRGVCQAAQVSLPPPGHPHQVASHRLQERKTRWSRFHSALAAASRFICTSLSMRACELPGRAEFMKMKYCMRRASLLKRV
ncbi:uncharacterized protein LOC101059252 [Pan troglodytes]|uniref:Uncharacterized protein n=1 Tax=Pan troglodytes TaxID=9598 RepID=G2HGI2_PANTR|nr:uncharacterized protein LOC101059252 [Pan troglodytes]BAK62840.1 hypothetical protein [Pan troglodytes]